MEYFIQYEFVNRLEMDNILRCDYRFEQTLRSLSYIENILQNFEEMFPL